MNNCIRAFLHFLLIVILLGCSNDQESYTEVAHKQQTDGWLAYNQGDFSLALLNFERAINLDPTLADAHNGLGWSHMSTSRVSAVNPQIVAKAQEAFKDAIRINQSNADAWVGLANTLFLRRERDSDFQTSLRAIDNAFDADHQFLFRHDYQSAADLHVLKAACYYYLGKTNLAKASVETTRRLDPQNSSALSLRRLLE